MWILTKNKIALNLMRTDRLSVKQKEDKSFAVVAYQGKISIIVRDGFFKRPDAEMYIVAGCSGGQFSA